MKSVPLSEAHKRKAMKQLLFMLLIIPMTTTSADLTLDSITKAISQGDIQALENYMDDTVEIAVMENEDIYMKAEAVKILKNFFSSNKPTSFSQVHKGASKGNESIYCIGNLNTNQQAFRVYIYIKVDKGGYYIQELRFDHE